MDTAQWPQGIGVVRPIVENSRPVDKKPRPQREQALNCPRCNSTNTKFCYYNNYSLSQPRYFCKTCRRYWTEGGTLRNVPVGGGSRKKQRPSSSSLSINSSASSSSSSKKFVLPDLSPPKFSPPNPKIHEGHDLNLAYNNPPIYNGMSELVALPFALDHTQNPNISSSSSSHLPFMELLRSAGGFSSSGGLSPLVSAPVSNSCNSLLPSGFLLHEFKLSSSLSVDGLENGYGNPQSAVQDHTNSSRIVFPFEESKPVSAGGEFEQDSGQQQGDSNGFWNGMLPGGSW